MTINILINPMTGEVKEFDYNYAKARLERMFKNSNKRDEIVLSVEA